MWEHSCCRSKGNKNYKSDFKFNLILSCIMSIITSLIAVIVRIVKYAHLNEYGAWGWLGLFDYLFFSFDCYTLYNISINNNFVQKLQSKNTKIKTPL